VSPDATLLALLDDAVGQRIVPGGQLVVVDAGQVVLRHAFGRLTYEGAPVTPATVYDVASLTKAVVTTTVVAKLVAAGRLDWETPVVTLLPYVPHPGLRVAHLLAHASGLPAWRPFYQRTAQRDDFPRLAAAEPLETAPGTRSVYSDLGFMLLGALCEAAGEERLDRLAARLIFAPLGMTASRFVDLTAGEREPAAAPTEVCPRRGLVQGEVHDDNCHAAGGILGHAGLFSTGDDLARFAIAACEGRAFPRGPVWSPANVPGSTWCLGWDRPSPGPSQAGASWPRTGVGHLGFTGCSLWIDPPRGRACVLLTNRVHPSRDGDGIKRLRPAVHDLVWQLL
jgi:serine-type D-Ala-D-Ala carboxypeptidase